MVKKEIARKIESELFKIYGEHGYKINEKTSHLDPHWYNRVVIGKEININGDLRVYLSKALFLGMQAYEIETSEKLLGLVAKSGVFTEKKGVYNSDFNIGIEYHPVDTLYHYVVYEGILLHTEEGVKEFIRKFKESIEFGRGGV